MAAANITAATTINHANLPTYEPIEVDEATFKAACAKWDAVCSAHDDGTVMLTARDVVIVISRWEDRDDHLKNPGWIDFATKYMNVDRCDDIWLK
jgi:hypothetical protein